MGETNLEVGQRIQEKFCFYIVGLTFTVLGLSIQTARFDGAVVCGALELTAWLALLCSGMVGLSRIARTPLFYELLHLKGNLERSRQQYTSMAADGDVGDDRDSDEPLSLAAEIEQLNEAIELGGSRIRGRQRALEVLWQVQTATFSSGIILLVAARGYTPFVNLVTGSP